MTLWMMSSPFFTGSWDPEMKLCRSSRVQTVSSATSAFSNRSTLPCHCTMQQQCPESECSTGCLTLQSAGTAHAFAQGAKPMRRCAWLASSASLDGNLRQRVRPCGSSLCELELIQPMTPGVFIPQV